MRAHKYGAKSVVIDGIRFDSTAEGKRYAELKLLARGNEIRELEIQPKFIFELAGKTMFTYLADFQYFDNKTLARVVEDVKGVRTPVYKLKKKIVEAHFGIRIVEL